jgi:hypothetical protein
MGQDNQRSHLREALQSLYNGWIVAENGYVKYACTSQANKYITSSLDHKLISQQEHKLLKNWLNTWGQSQKLAYNNGEFVEIIPNQLEIMKRLALVGVEALTGK